MIKDDMETAEVMPDPMVRMRSVEDFCYRYRLGRDEERRLTNLFGPFASERELLSHASRAPALQMTGIIARPARG